MPSMGLTRWNPLVLLAPPMSWLRPVASPMTTVSRYAMPWTPPAPYPTLKVELILYGALNKKKSLDAKHIANETHTLLCWNPECMAFRPQPIE